MFYNCFIIVLYAFYTLCAHLASPMRLDAKLGLVGASLHYALRLPPHFSAHAWSIQVRRRPDRTPDSESSFGGLARVLPQTCVRRPSCPPSCSNVGTTAQSVTPPKSNSHRNPQSLARGARSTSRGTVLPNQTIGVYGKTGLTDMASCCRCTASVRGLAVIVNIGARAPCQWTYKRTRLRTQIQILAKPPWWIRNKWPRNTFPKFLSCMRKQRMYYIWSDW